MTPRRFGGRKSNHTTMLPQIHTSLLRLTCICHRWAPYTQCCTRSRCWCRFLQTHMHVHTREQTHKCMRRITQAYAHTHTEVSAKQTKKGLCKVLLMYAHERVCVINCMCACMSMCVCAFAYVCFPVRKSHRHACWHSRARAHTHTHKHKSVREMMMWHAM